MANPSLGEAVLRTRLDPQGLRTGLNTARGETERTLTTLDRRLEATGQRLQRLGTGLTIGLTAPIAALGVAATRAASDAEETRSKFQTVFRDIGDSAQAAADRLSDSYGQSDRAAQGLLANTGDLLTGFGFTQEAALDLSSQVNELAIDLASFTNFSGGAEGASQALTSALLGEREAAKSLGIAITEDVVQAKLEELRATGQLIGETERQQEAYATLLIAQEQSANAIGDFARTQDSFANQTRILNANLEDLRVALGEGILPVVTPLVGRLADAAGALSGMDEGTRNTVIALGGLAAAAGPVTIALGSLARAIVAIRTAALPLLGPAGILLGAAAGFVALNEAMNAGTRTRQQASTDYRDLVRSMGAYRDQLVITSEEERAQIQATLNRRREALQRVLEMQRAYVASLEADVIAFANKGFFGQLFGFGEANVNIDALDNAEAELADIEQQIAGIDTQLGEVREMEIRPNVNVPPPADTGDGYDAFGIPVDGSERSVRLRVEPTATVTARGLPTTPAAAQPPGPSRPSDAIGFGTLDQQLAAAAEIAADTREALGVLQLATPNVTAGGGQPVALTAPNVSVTGDRVDLGVTPELSRDFPSAGEDRRASIQVGQARFGSVEQQIAYTEQLRAQYIARFGARDLGVTPVASLGPSDPRALPIPQPQLGGEPVTLPVPEPVATGFEDAAQSVKDAAAEQQRAGLDFAKNVVNAGNQFISAIGQFQAGNIGGGVAGLAGTAGSLFSSIGSLAGLAGAGPIGALIGAGGGLLGGLINLFGGGGGNDLDQVRQQEAQRARSVPAITFEATVNQNNTYNGGPQMPEVEQAFRRYSRIAIEEFMAATRLPQRVAALETA